MYVLRDQQQLLLVRATLSTDFNKFMFAVHLTDHRQIDPRDHGGGFLEVHPALVDSSVGEFEVPKL